MTNAIALIQEFPGGYTSQRALNKLFTDEQYIEGLELIREQIEALEEDLEEAYQQQLSQSSKRNFPHWNRRAAGYFFIALEWLKADSNQLIVMVTQETKEWDSFEGDRVNYNPDGESRALEILNQLKNL